MARLQLRDHDLVPCLQDVGQHYFEWEKMVMYKVLKTLLYLLEKLNKGILIFLEKFMLYRLQKIQGIRVIGDPLLSVIAFDVIPPLNIYAIADLLSQKGWHLNILQFPASIHIACTLLTVHAIEELLDDIQTAIDMLKRNPNAGNGNIAAIYGTSASIPDRSVVGDVARGFLDGLTKI